MKLGALIAIAGAAAATPGTVISPGAATPLCKPELAAPALALTGSGRFSGAVRTEPRDITSSRPFSVEIALCAPAGTPAAERVAVDAEMPEHRHGMNYRATVTDQGAGRFRAEGLLFHMPGRWELIVEVHADQRTDTLKASLEVE